MNILLKDAIINYPTLVEPKPYSPGDTPKYSAQILIPKGSIAEKTLSDAIAKIKSDNFTAKKNPTSICWRDGDTDPKAPNNGADHIFTSANSVKKPEVYNLQMQPIDPKLVVGTDTCHVMISVYYTPKGGGRICAGLEKLIHVSEGDRDFAPSEEQQFATFVQLLAEQDALPADVQQNLLGTSTVEADGEEVEEEVEAVEM